MVNGTASIDGRIGEAGEAKGFDKWATSALKLPHLLDGGARSVIGTNDQVLNTDRQKVSALAQTGTPAFHLAVVTAACDASYFAASRVPSVNLGEIQKKPQPVRHRRGAQPNAPPNLPAKIDRTRPVIRQTSSANR